METALAERDPMSSFGDVERDFLELTSSIVWCTAATVDGRGRPRSRILHPIFTVRDGRPVGWVVTGRTPLKTRHLAANPHVSCTYWTPTQDTVIVDCVATWVEDVDERRRVFELFTTTPSPLGYPLEYLGGERWESPLFTPLRLDAWRVQVMRGSEFPSGNLAGRVWRTE
jgi:uncharacterized pyridoxamine 5'-phosphate oxidase family protein